MEQAIRAHDIFMVFGEEVVICPRKVKDI